MRIPMFTGVALLSLAWPVFGQLGQFEAADVRVSEPSTNPDSFASGGVLRGGGYSLRRATMQDLIRIAWGVEADKVVGGPGWLTVDRFDVVAMAPASATPAMIPMMLQSLLTDRFRLQVHKDSRPLAAFVLRQASAKHKLKEGDGRVASGCRQQSKPGNTVRTYTCAGVSMAAFARALTGMAGDYLTAAVVDSTGLEGAWDFDLQWNPRSFVPREGPRVTIFEAVGTQLGLKLESGQAQASVIVVDRVNERPRDNPPGTPARVSALPGKFEVATIKLSAEGERFGMKRYPGGRLELRAFPMRMLIATAWDLDWDHMDETIAGAPKWIDSRRFDIVAEAPEAAGEQPGSGALDADLRAMLRALLMERFGIASHLENRPVMAYSLMAVKPKLARADASRRTGCHEAGTLARDPRDLTPVRSRLIECRNITMEQFAVQLENLDRVEATFYQVADETGLKGAYDFSVSFSPRAAVQSGGDDGGAIAFPEALRQQVGLKLDAHKRPLPVLVIDRIDERFDAN